MGIEKRKEERLVACGISKGELYHHESGQHFIVESVRNLSAKGVGFKVNTFLQQGDLIRLGFKHGRVHHQLCGRVAWCAPSEDGESPNSFFVGVHLN